MNNPLRPIAEGLARRTTRRGFFSRTTDVAFGALAGIAAGSLAATRSASAGFGTICDFPGPPCPCDGCLASGVCAKPCVMYNYWYASGCWVAGTTGDVTCCDCNCNGLHNITVCGCGSDYQNDPARCPDGPGPQ